MATYSIPYLRETKEFSPFIRKETIQKVGKLIRAYAVSTFAAITFNFPVSLLSEVVLYRMTLSQSLSARSKGAMISLVSGIIYAKYCDGIYKLTNTTKDSSKSRRRFLDAACSLTYGLPMYALNLASSGASKKQIGFALVCSFATSFATAKYSRDYLNYLRRASGTMPDKV